LLNLPFNDDAFSEDGETDDDIIVIDDIQNELQYLDDDFFPEMNELHLDVLARIPQSTMASSGVTIKHHTKNTKTQNFTDVGELHHKVTSNTPKSMSAMQSGTEHHESIKKQKKTKSSSEVQEHEPTKR
jgi:hypothetical protein